MLGEQRLVRGDDVLARRDRREHGLLRLGRAAEELAHDVDVGARDGFRRLHDERVTHFPAIGQYVSLVISLE